jgi:hypothetical protein
MMTTHNHRYIIFYTFINIATSSDREHDTTIIPLFRIHSFKIYNI